VPNGGQPQPPARTPGQRLLAHLERRRRAYEDGQLELPPENWNIPRICVSLGMRGLVSLTTGHQDQAVDYHLTSQEVLRYDKAAGLWSLYSEREWEALFR
jgi:hypothetical protein